MDAITMWDYLEHSPDPLGDLKACCLLLRQGGVILLSIPNVDSWSYRLLGKKWIGFKNIEHLYFFSRDTMEKLARQAGLIMEYSFYHGKYVSLGKRFEELAVEGRRMSLEQAIAYALED